MKKIIILSICLLVSNILFSQVGINTDEPNTNTLLHVSERMKSTDSDINNTLKGILIPRLTEEERDILTYENPLSDPKVFKLLASDNSLMIYNTTEECYNYWSYPESEWMSLCGKLSKSEFTFICPTDITVFGTYIQGKELTTSNYLSIKVNVTKPGEYTIVATTTNDYSFFATGTFLNSGSYTVMLAGQGTPTNTGLNDLWITANGIEATCDPIKQVEVLTSAGSYTVGCNEIIVDGVYRQGVALSSSNTITVPVNVSVLGSWSIHTNSVDGISFSGSGTFTSIGTQYITLNGTGIPTSIITKKMTLTYNSEGLENSGCQFDVIIVIPEKTLLSIGSEANGYGYNLSGSAASGTLITDPRNYGTLPNSIVKFEGFTRINGSNNPSESQLRNWLLGSNPVDILVLGYSWEMTAAEADIIAEYILKNGVVLAYSQSTVGNTRLFQTLFNDINIRASRINAAGALYKLPVVDDRIMNGPFGDIRGRFWGEDASTTSRIEGLPLNDIEVYSSDADFSDVTPESSGAITAFKHKNFNLIWIGDGGFNSNRSAYSNTICPFELDENNFPTFKPNYGRGAIERHQSVYNAVFTANAIAWAIHKAEFDGINTK